MAERQTARFRSEEISCRENNFEAGITEEDTGYKS
jgi:hypothetical protein